jgi:hypothetical protein
MGVTFDKRCKTKPYFAYAREGGKNKMLGSYETRGEAEIVAATYEMKKNGFSEQAIQARLAEIQGRNKPRAVNLKFGVIEK